MGGEHCPVAGALDVHGEVGVHHQRLQGRRVVQVGDHRDAGLADPRMVEKERAEREKDVRFLDQRTERALVPAVAHDLEPLAVERGLVAAGQNHLELAGERPRQLEGADGRPGHPWRHLVLADDQQAGPMRLTVATVLGRDSDRDGLRGALRRAGRRAHGRRPVPLACGTGRRPAGGGRRISPGGRHPGRDLPTGPLLGVGGVAEPPPPDGGAHRRRPADGVRGERPAAGGVPRLR